MESCRRRAKKKSSILPWLFLLTAIFIIGQIIFILSYDPVIDYFRLILGQKTMAIPALVWTTGIWFCLTQLVIYVVFTSAIWLVAKLVAQLLRLNAVQTFRLGVTLWGLSVAAVLLANRVFFPHSIFSEALSPILPVIISKSLLCCASFLLVAAVVLALLRLGKIVLAIMLIGLLIFVVYYNHKQEVISAQKYSQPNVIIIGLDALRPDHVGYYNHNKKDLPITSHFLSQSTNFTQSISPLSQTSPAWMSILTGQYPKNNGIRFIYAPLGYKVPHNVMLNSILKKRGYESIYAIDDWRYDVMTNKYGFDHLIGKVPKVNNFLFGTINDFPLTNLLVNTKLGKWLFPYSYANRAVYETYKPHTFIDLLRDTLKTVGHRPLFLCVHLCLPHWPYAWATSKGDILSTESQFLVDNSDPVLYGAAAQRVDQQFGNLLKLLRQFHLLDNTIVVLMSDHGEGLGIPGDRLLTRKKYVAGKVAFPDLFRKLLAVRGDNKRLDISLEHGNDILSMSQTHNVLAFRLFGKNKNAKQSIRSLASLIDIKPTILNYLGVQAPAVDGENLLPYINGKKATKKPRMFFIESGFYPPALREKNISIEAAVKQSLPMFQVNNKTGDLNLNSKILPQLLFGKERGVYYDGWILAYYPINKNEIIPVLVNRKTGKWTVDLNSQFAQNSPAKKMLTALKEFYGKEI